MKAVVAAFKQEKALVGAFSVITNLRMDLFEALLYSRICPLCILPSPFFIRWKDDVEYLDIVIWRLGGFCVMTVINIPTEAAPHSDTFCILLPSR